MKKMMTRLLVIGLAITLMVGCSNKQKNNGKEENSKTAGSENVQKENGNVIKDDIAVKFKEILSSDDPLKVKAFILKNIKTVDKDTADFMVEEYEMILKEDYNELFEKYIKGKYFSAINGAIDEEYILNIEKIKDEEIRKEIIENVSAGYTFKMLEGDYYLDIDYKIINDTFGEYLSETRRPYYELRKKELENPAFAEEYLSIKFQELKDRAVNLETFIIENSNFKNKEDIKFLMNSYIRGLMKVDWINGTVDSETGAVNSEVKAVFESLKASNLMILRYVAEEMDALFGEYDYNINMSNKEHQDLIFTTKSRVMKEAGEMFEKNYLVVDPDINLDNIAKKMMSESVRDEKLEKAIVEALEGYDKQTDGAVNYYYNRINLNLEDKAEIFVFLTGQYVSGTGGSTALIFEDKEDNYELVSRITLVRNPIIVSKNKSNGWNDLIMQVYGGGVKPFYAQMRSDRKKYPGNPSVEPQATNDMVVDGIAIISDDLMKNKGIELRHFKINN